MTPTPPLTPGGSPQAQPGSWADYAQWLPKDITDTGYNAIRENFFFKNLAPSVLQSGQSIESAKDAFMQASERPKVEYPRLETTAINAFKGIADPILHTIGPISSALGDTSGVVGKAADWVAKAADAKAAEMHQEMQKQEIPTAPYEWGGQALGMAPYFAGGVGAAESLGEKAILSKFPEAGKLLTEGGQTVLSKEAYAAVEAYKSSLIGKATRAGAVGLVQGAYDAAVAPEGEKGQAFLKGAAIGGGIAAGVESIGPLWSLLRANHNLDVDSAKAVEAVAKGGGTPKDEALTTRAVLKTTDLDKTIGDYVTQGKAAQSIQGVPIDSTLDSTPTGDPKPPVFTPSGRVRIQMLGADGQTYHLGGAVGLKAEDVDTIQRRVVEHLNAGGRVQAINGDPALVIRTQRQIEELNPDAFTLSNPIRPGDPSNPPAVSAKVKAAPITEDAQVKAKPTPEVIPPKVTDTTDTSTPPEPPKIAVARASGYAVNPSDIPDYDKFMQLPSGELVNKETGEVHDPKAADAGWNVEPQEGSPPVYGRVRGSSDIPLSLKGQVQTKSLGERIAAKGGLDTLHMADLKRYRQTADNIMAGDKMVNPQMPNPALRSRALGGFEGMDQTPTLMAEINHTVDNPTLRPEGMGEKSTMPGESLNQFKARILPQVQQHMEDVLSNPEKKVGIVTSSQDIGLIKSWLAHGKGDIDPKVLKNSYENPGSVYRLAPDGKGWSIRAVDMDADAQLKGGVYMIRHGETPWNKSARQMEMKDRPLANRGYGSNPLLGDTRDGIEIEYPGQSKPTIMLRDATDKAAVFHENLHGHLGALDMHDSVEKVMDDPMADKIFNAGFAPVAKDLYGDNPKVWREEVYVHGADAIRTGNDAKIQSFADADDGKDHWLDWMSKKTDEIRAEAATKDDSLHKRVLERRLGAVQSRATNSLSDIRNTNSQAPSQMDFAQGQYALKEGDKSTLYPSREDALQDLEKYGEPLNSPELVPLDRLPEGMPRYSRGVRPMSSGERPNVTDPPSPEVAEGGPRQARGGLQLASRFFRPFNDWVATVAQKNEWPELYSAFAPLDQAQVQFNNTVRQYYKILQKTLGGLTEQRQKDFMTWFRNPGDDFVKGELRITPSEENMMKMVKATVLDPLESKFSTSLEDWRDRALPKDNFLMTREARGSLDPKEDNFSKLVAKYLEFGAWNEHIKPSLDVAEKVAQEKMEGGGKRAGNLLPLLQRHIDFLRGQPDYTQEIIKGALEGSLHLINQGFEKLGMDYRLKEISEDPLGKYTLFMYAGALAMKPATIIRDGLQLMLTTFPIGGKYTFKGIEKAFGAFDPAKREALWDIPQKYGALLEKADLRSLYDGGTGGEEVGSKIGGTMSALKQGATKAAEFGMKSIQLTHNGNRLAAFWGHSEQILDALDTLRTTGDKDRFLRDSGMWFMSKSQQDSFMKEIPDLKKGAATNDFSYRASKELVELSQWNFKRGANPGLYEYQLGRLFGQYGTWPLNYIEYARRLATAGDGKAQRQALVRLGLAHGAVLAAGQSMGVDTGRWVFTGPMAYEGGPLFNALTSLPSAAAPGEEGKEARENLLVAIPGFERIEGLKDAFMDITSGSDGGYMRLLGFHAMHSADYHKGLHQFISEDKE